MSARVGHSPSVVGPWVSWIPLAVFSLCAPARAAQAQAPSSKPPLIVQYHMWWDTRYGVQSKVWPTTSRSNQRPGDYVWGYWDRREYGVGTQSPDSAAATGWGRISSNTRDYYPMIGLYDPDDPEILRWYIRAAKAAGVDAFAFSLYDWWFNPLAERRLAEIFQKALDVAREENFKIAWEAWWGGENLPAFFNRYEDLLAHPSFYKVRYGGADLPVIWIAPGRAPANFFGDTVAQFDGIIESIERNAGPCVGRSTTGRGSTIRPLELGRS